MTLNGSMSGTLSSAQTLSGSLSLGGGSVPVDPTLSIEGAAADAKAVGEKKADIIVDKAFGAVANMPDAKGELPVNELIINIKSTQAGSGDPSPSNIRTINGWTGATIYHSGADTSDYDTVTVSWQTEAGTVYGGTLNVTTGVLQPTHALYNLGSQNWSYATSGSGRMQTNGIASVVKRPASDTAIGDIFCEIYKPNSSSKVYLGNAGIAVNPSNGYIWVYDANMGTDAAAFKTAVTGKYLVYPLATLPDPIQLTPVEVTTLLGENNIWADCGDVEVEYKCDTKKYIQKLTMPTEDDMIANANIVNHKYFTIGNNLYYSTASIAAGEKIIVGTNCNRVSLAEALNNINS